MELKRMFLSIRQSGKYYQIQEPVACATENTKRIYILSVSEFLPNTIRVKQHVIYNIVYDVHVNTISPSQNILF